MCHKVFRILGILVDRFTRPVVVACMFCTIVILLTPAALTFGFTCQLPGGGFDFGMVRLHCYIIYVWIAFPMLLCGATYVVFLILFCIVICIKWSASCSADTVGEAILALELGTCRKELVGCCDCLRDRFKKKSLTD
jgi:hypothetical protein